MSPRTKVEECRHQKTQTQRSNSPDQPQGVIWGGIPVSIPGQIFVISLLGAFSTNLKGQIDQLQLELHQQLSDIKHLTEQKVFQTLHDNLQWLNPKNWFDGLNLQVWVMAALVCVLVLILICALLCIWRLFSRDRVPKQQMVLKARKEG